MDDWEEEDDFVSVSISDVDEGQKSPYLVVTASGNCTPERQSPSPITTLSDPKTQYQWVKTAPLDWMSMRKVLMMNETKHWKLHSNEVPQSIFVGTGGQFPEVPVVNMNGAVSVPYEQRHINKVFYVKQKMHKLQRKSKSQAANVRKQKATRKRMGQRNSLVSMKGQTRNGASRTRAPRFFKHKIASNRKC